MISTQDLKERSNAIGERLAEARAALGIDQTELSRRSEVSRVMISDFERGTRVMSVEHLFRLSEGASIRPEWLLTGRGEMRSDGVSLEEIQYQARQGRALEYTFTATVNRMVTLYGPDKRRMTWALGSCVRAYWGVPWLGFADLREVTQVLLSVSDQLGLELHEVLESINNLNACQGIADWLPHRGMDPNAFHAVWNKTMTEYQVHYDLENARPKEALLEEARCKGIVIEEPQSLPNRRTFTDFLRGLRIFDPGTKEP